MGLYAASELIGMISRGAPYWIPGRHLTPVFFANAPLEFIFFVAIAVIGVGLFLVGPLFLVVKRWRFLTRAPTETH
jgi:hypothetical protein